MITEFIKEDSQFCLTRAITRTGRRLRGGRVRRAHPGGRGVAGFLRRVGSGAGHDSVALGAPVRDRDPEQARSDAALRRVASCGGRVCEGCPFPQIRAPVPATPRRGGWWGAGAVGPTNGPRGACQVRGPAPPFPPVTDEMGVKNKGACTGKVFYHRAVGESRNSLGSNSPPPRHIVIRHAGGFRG